MPPPNQFSSPKSVIAQPPCQEGEFDGPPQLSLLAENQIKWPKEEYKIDASKPLSLEDFIAELPDTIRKTHNETSSSGDSDQSTIGDIAFSRGADDDPISALYKRLDISKRDWEQFALFEPSRKYTRNLVATDNQTYTLILMCWSPDKESPIHDHPCDGCWMRVLEGSVRENRYIRDESTDTLSCISDRTFVENQLAYITDSMGLHKVGNPSSEDRAVTLHLYSPPFKACKIWLNPSLASKPSNCCMEFFSEYGRII